LPDDVGGGGIRYGHRYEVTVGLSLLREGLSEVEGEGVRRDSGTLLLRAFLLGRLDFRRGRGDLGMPLTFGSGGDE